ncbi:MAG: hypothetical protein COT15_00140 [Candidatus Diapherotrites archaeon CG08_land_8_20_14_0_20_34_12]|nr:MAG: hypothetical protein COT15_00140 [Candidatus Diapherotrites archaeon CG08_land_8_20_14_0_20_34_12]
MPNKIRAIAFDDGCFEKGKSLKTKLVGVIFRSDSQIEGILCDEIFVDRLDSTALIEKMIKKSRFADQIRYIFLSGLNFAGFNIVDMPKLYSMLKIPIIVTLKKKPDMVKINSALAKFHDSMERIALIKKAGKLHSYKKIYYQKIGLDEKQAQHIIDAFTYTSNMPEPVRLAHIIASGLTLGESTRP